MEEGFNIIFAKVGGSPKSKFFMTRREVIEFFLLELNNIDFLSVNDVPIDINKMLSNKKLLRYLKIKKINEI